MEYNYTLVVRSEPGEIDGEATLVAAAKINPTAFEPLYQRYKGRIYRYLFLRLRREEDAADLTQQVFLKALGALPGYRERGLPFAAWLFRIAHHTVSDAYRQEKSAVSWDVLSDDEQLIAEIDLENMVLQQERLAHLRQLLDQLDPYKRELLALRFSAGLSTTEIALVVGKSQAAVKKQLTRTLQGLKEQMT
ncbi:MAG TPA: sigma-70 family RNA polymerase sigma factor [Ktedonobacteraceae bacterium]|nr:sigma-70 family RNA polymerase sigma factor [Ktedonobacteraceae bacterium]